MEKQNRTSRATFRLTEETYSKLREQSDKNFRNMSEELEVILREYFTKREEEKK